ncbi:UNVERIFIED_CONTAM: putative ion channel SYM8 [Sesamum radiatum]|uniref:Ion channel SYM8 n=1 Tax=Sesamum radiatum TaxID=300843 RepID=A0AAW2MUE3_SESRA
MQATNAQSIAGQSPGKPERPPLNKKFRTADSGGDDAQTPHFPAVRRLSPSPSFNSTSSSTSTTTNASSSAPTTTGGGLSSSSSDAFSFNFSDRDYVFPSNLGPYSTRRNVTVKSSSSFSKSQQQKQQSQSQLPVRSTSMPPSLSSAGGGGGSTVDSARGIGSPVTKPKLRAEKDLKALSLQASASASSALVPTASVASGPRDSANSYSVQKTSSFRNSWKAFWDPDTDSFPCDGLLSSLLQAAKFLAGHLGTGFLKIEATPSVIRYELKFFCFISVSYAIFLRNKVTRLQEENTNLRRFCSHENTIGSNSIEVLELENGRSFLYLGKTDPRVIALYTVLVTLITPFVLYKYIDYLPRIKNLSKRTKDSKEEVPLKKRIAYMVDVCFSVYPYAKLLALLFATLFLIGFGGLALYAVSDGSFTEALWLSWTFVADSGNHADRVGTGPRIVSVSISSGGMLIFAMMLGLVSDAISEKVDSLRKGKSEVIESNHILILGWSDKLGSLLKQLAIANKSIGGGVIVVLAERDKEEMEMDIAKLEFDLMGTSVICRSGSPLILADLKKVSVSKARAIIVLASDENADQSDARALRVVLSLTGVKEGLRGHVVVEMSDLDNEPLVKLVGGELIETVVAHDVIGRLMIQCALQPGLAQGNELCIKPAEFYLYDQEELCFYDIMIRGRQRKEIVIGYRLATAERAVINPVSKSTPRKWSIDDVFVVISSGE